MLQRLASNPPALSLAFGLLAFGLLAGCRGPIAQPIPRTLGGASVPGAFVPPSAYEAYVRGELALAEGRPEQAVAQFELASTAPDEDAYLLSRLAYAQLRAGQLAEAKRTLDHAERLDRCAEEVWLTRGQLAEQAGQHEAARSAYLKATHCAPRSPAGELALARLLEKQGEQAQALDLLARAAERPFGQPAEAALARSLAKADPAALAYTLARLGNQRAAESAALLRAMRTALDRDLPRLALRLREQHRAPLPPLLEAELLLRNGQREQLAALLARTDTDDLGGSVRTAQLAIGAGAYERAELEASDALRLHGSDDLRAIRARALLALGRRNDALPELAAVTDPLLRRQLLTEALAQSGAAALARELAVRGQDVRAQQSAP